MARYVYGSYVVEKYERVPLRDKVRAWWRKFGSEGFTPEPVMTRTDRIDDPRDTCVQIAAGMTMIPHRTRAILVAELLYDNRLGWSDNRGPHAPRAFWVALGLALGKDVRWVHDTASSEADGQLTLQAAYMLLRDCETGSS